MENLNQADNLSAWWERSDLCMINGRLSFCGRYVDDVALPYSQPLYIYGLPRVRDNISRLSTALSSHGIRHRLYYAMKASRSVALLCHLHKLELHGLDVCSTREIKRALSCGYSVEQLSFTPHGLSPTDLHIISALPNLLVNCDSLAALSAVGQASPGRDIGIRINPSIGYGANSLLTYAGNANTKFGIYEAQFSEALEISNIHRMSIVSLHCHAGSGYLTDQLSKFSQVLDQIDSFANKIPTLKFINLGGGLGVPHRPEEAPLILNQWAGAIAARFGSRFTIIAEPGEYLIKDAGMLVLRVNYAERKDRTFFVGLNGGFNLAMEPAFYDLPCTPVPCKRRPGPEIVATVVGNINEALDVWARDIPLSPLLPGDMVTLLNTGAYSSSMASDHCMNGDSEELILL